MTPFSLTCARIRRWLAEGEYTDAVQHHLVACLGCQQVQSQYLALETAMAELPELTAPSTLLPRVMAALAEDTPMRSTRRPLGRPPRAWVAVWGGVLLLAGLVGSSGFWSPKPERLPVAVEAPPAYQEVAWTDVDGTGRLQDVVGF